MTIPHIHKQALLPTSINKRISTISSKQFRTQHQHIRMHYVTTTLAISRNTYRMKHMQQPRRNRQRSVIWFSSLFSQNVKTNIARSFLQLVGTHFPAGHKLHKIFNRNTVKVSYSCMNSVRSIITNHNVRMIRKNQPQVISADNCNCRNKEACALQNKCMNKDIVYKATMHQHVKQHKPH